MLRLICRRYYLFSVINGYEILLHLLPSYHFKLPILRLIYWNSCTFYRYVLMITCSISWTIFSKPFNLLLWSISKASRSKTSSPYRQIYKHLPQIFSSTRKFSSRIKTVLVFLCPCCLTELFHWFLNHFKSIRICTAFFL